MRWSFKYILLGILAVVVVAGNLYADTVTLSYATDVVNGWLLEKSERLGMTFGDRIRWVDIVRDDEGAILFYAFSIVPTGYIIVSADDLIEPIVAFSNKGDFSGNEENPLSTMLQKDMPQRLGVALDLQCLRQQSSRSGDISLTDAEAYRLKQLERHSRTTQSEWQRLKVAGESVNEIIPSPSLTRSVTSENPERVVFDVVSESIGANLKLNDGQPQIQHNADDPVTVWAKEGHMDWDILESGITSKTYQADVDDDVAWFVVTEFHNEPPPSSMDTIDDIRVDPLVQSRWSQSYVNGYMCYNAFTPNNFVCGCVATAMAQLMRYHQYPTQPIGVKNRMVYVDYKTTILQTRGGDGAGGAYDWDAMELVPNSVEYNVYTWEMIGSLCYDAGLAAQMKYSMWGSGAYLTDAANGLKETFGYNNAVFMYADNDSDRYLKSINSNLEAGLPVILGIYKTYSGHAIVCDGYGYASGAAYHHINMGWSGSADAWYNLPQGVYGFTMINDLIYNVFTETSGEIISGRVTDEYGAPVAGAEVRAVCDSTGGIYTDETDSRGYYGIIGVPAGSSFTVTAEATSYTAEPIVGVETGSSTWNQCGNAERTDFMLAVTD